MEHLWYGLWQLWLWPKWHILWQLVAILNVPFLLSARAKVKSHRELKIEQNPSLVKWVWNRAESSSSFITKVQWYSLKGVRFWFILCTQTRLFFFCRWWWHMNNNNYIVVTAGWCLIAAVVRHFERSVLLRDKPYRLSRQQNYNFVHVHCETSHSEPYKPIGPHRAATCEKALMRMYSPLLWEFLPIYNSRTVRTRQ